MINIIKKVEYSRYFDIVNVLLKSKKLREWNTQLL